MRSTQNGNRVLARKKQESKISCKSLQDSVDELIENLQARADSLNKKRCNLDDRVHWIARGRQQALRRASARLRAIGASSLSSYTLYLALQDYLACLEKYVVDVEEEKDALVTGIWPVEQWKAEGEAQELPRLVRLLSRMVQAHTPYFVHHTLSLDGKRLVSLRLGSDEQRREQVVSAQPLQILEAPRLLADPHKVSELVPAGNEQCHERTSLLVRRGTDVPTLGPFPILPDEISEVQQTILLSLEDALSHHGRVLVNTERAAAAVDTVGLLFMFLDRVLQYTPVERILVLAGSRQLLAHLRQRYRTWISLENGIPLPERYVVQYKPTVPLAPETQICFSSIREMQVVTRSLCEQDAVLCKQTYDMVITYDLTQLSAPWQQVLASFDVPYYVGFGVSSDQLVAGLFDFEGFVGHLTKKLPMPITRARARGKKTTKPIPDEVRSKPIASKTRKWANSTTWIDLVITYSFQSLFTTSAAFRRKRSASRFTLPLSNLRGIFMIIMVSLTIFPKRINKRFCLLNAINLQQMKS